jgi:heptosyltransferase-2
MRLTKEEKVYAVHSLDEVREVLCLNEEFDIKNLLKRGFVTVWVFAANCSLRILRFLLFKKWGYSRREFKNVVVYTVGIIGDNVAMLPALAALRHKYQRTKITVITNCQIWDRDGAIGILEPSPFKDRLIVLEDDAVQRKGFRFLINYKKFEGTQCDLFVNLSPFGNRGWIGAVVREMIFAKKLGARYAIGFKMSTYSRKGIFNKVQHRFVKNEPRRSREILKELELEPIENKDLLTHDEAAKESILKKISENGRDHRPIFVINPGAKFQVKCWPVERFGEVAKHLAYHYDASIVITGNTYEEDIADDVVKKSGGVAINLAGRTTIQELIELLRMAKGLITNDTGPMHIGAMVGVPTVALFSLRFSPTHWFPFGHGVVSVFSLVDCIYCYRDSCETLDCMKRIKVGDVVSVLNGLSNPSRISAEYFDVKAP